MYQPSYRFLNYTVFLERCRRYRTDGQTSVNWLALSSIVSDEFLSSFPLFKIQITGYFDLAGWSFQLYWLCVQEIFMSLNFILYVASHCIEAGIIPGKLSYKIHSTDSQPYIVHIYQKLIEQQPQLGHMMTAQHEIVPRHMGWSRNTQKVQTYPDVMLPMQYNYKIKCILHYYIPQLYHLILLDMYLLATYFLHSDI